MRPYSLRRRLLLWLFMATAGIGVLALLDTWREAVQTAQSLSDRVLAGSALAIAERVTVDETGALEVDIPFSALEMLASTAQDKVFYRIDGPPEQFLTGYGDLAQVPGPAGTVVFADGVYGAVGIRSATLRRAVSTGDRLIPFSVTVAESTLSRAELTRAILLRSAVRLMVLILAIAGVVWVAVTLALRPLDRLGTLIADRAPDDLRSLTVQTPQETEALVAAINSFMGRLGIVLEALRNFTGNASHQLRTPLSVVRTQLALIDRSAGPDQTDATSKAMTALVRAERVLAQLLVLARVDAATGAARMHRVNLVALAKDLVADAVPQALLHQIDLGYEGVDQGFAMAEPVLLGELLKNIVDNAIAYAGRGAVVTVRVRQTPDGAVLEVEDNGPGLSADQIAHATQRRYGMATPARDHAAGYGLGLGITGEIAALFGARLDLLAGAHGQGLRATVAFPAIPSGKA